MGSIYPTTKLILLDSLLQETSNTSKAMKVLLICALFGAALSEVYFEEKFGAGWEDRWVQSNHKGADAGKFVLSAGKFYGDAKLDQGIQTSQDAKFYALSAEFKPFSNVDKPLVIQFTVKHEQNIDCGGGYVKLFDCKLDQTDMHGDSPYNVMFGPDICGPGTKKVHVIFEHKGKNHLIKKDIRCKDDVFTHLYTLIPNTDGSFEVLIDNEKAESGTLTDDWDFLPPKKIKDPEAKKPADWVDNAKMDDPEDSKPEDWEKPEHIADPDATKPEDWDDEMDGEWEPPMIDNPEYKGEWKPRQIDNPDYKGAWVHPEIDSPDYNPADAEGIAKYEENCKIGFDLWRPAGSRRWGTPCPQGTRSWGCPRSTWVDRNGAPCGGGGGQRGVEHGVGQAQDGMELGRGSSRRLAGQACSHRERGCL